MIEKFLFFLILFPRLKLFNSFIPSKMTSKKTNQHQQSNLGLTHVGRPQEDVPGPEAFEATADNPPTTDDLCEISETNLTLANGQLEVGVVGGQTGGSVDKGQNFLTAGAFPIKAENEIKITEHEIDSSRYNNFFFIIISLGKYYFKTLLARKKRLFLHS